MQYKAEFVRTKKKKRHKWTHSKTTAANSKRLATKQVPSASPSSPAFEDVRFVEIGFEQLSSRDRRRKNTKHSTHSSAQQGYVYEYTD